MCVSKFNDENNQEKNKARERERKGKRNQNCYFNNDQPVSSDEAYLSRCKNKMRGKAYKYMRNECPRQKNHKLQ